MEENFAECNILHEEAVKKVKQKMPEDGFIYDLAELFKVFGDSTRIKIICALFESEMCVYDLAATLQMTQSAISHQLRILKNAKFLTLFVTSLNLLNFFFYLIDKCILKII